MADTADESGIEKQTETEIEFADFSRLHVIVAVRDHGVHGAIVAQKVAAGIQSPAARRVAA